jgi:hypothetical protein
VVGASSSTGSGTGTGSTLAFTGGNTRNLLSLALLLMAAGLFVLGRYYRRRADET